MFRGVSQTNSAPNYEKSSCSAACQVFGVFFSSGIISERSTEKSGVKISIQLPTGAGEVQGLRPAVFMKTFQQLQSLSHRWHFGLQIAFDFLAA